MIGRLVREFILKLSWRRRSVARVSRSLGSDLGVPDDVMLRIMDETNEELRALVARDEAGDARAIIEKAICELSKYKDDSHSDIDDAAAVRWLEDLPDREHAILTYSKQGKRHREIAELMQTDVEFVRRTLARLHVDLRFKTGGLGDGPGELQTETEEPSVQRADR